MGVQGVWTSWQGRGGSATTGVRGSAPQVSEADRSTAHQDYITNQGDSHQHCRLFLWKSRQSPVEILWKIPKETFPPSTLFLTIDVNDC